MVIPTATTAGCVDLILAHGARIVMNVFWRRASGVLCNEVSLVCIPRAAIVNRERASILLEMAQRGIVEVDSVEAFFEARETWADAEMTRSHALVTLLLDGAAEPLDGHYVDLLSEGLNKTADEIVAMRGAWAPYFFNDGRAHEWYTFTYRDGEPVGVLDTQATRAFNALDALRTPTLAMTLAFHDVGLREALNYVEIVDREATVANAMMTEYSRDAMLQVDESDDDDGDDAAADDGDMSEEGASSTETHS